MSYNKKPAFKLIVFVIFVLLFTISACSVDGGSGSSEKTTKDVQTKSEFILDTIITVSVYEGPKISEEDWNKIFFVVRDVDKKMSAYRDKSEIKRLNDSAGKSEVEISEDTYKVLKEALRIAEISGGYFDPTIGSLVSLWRIGTDKEGVPSEAEINSAKKNVSYNNLILKEIDDNEGPKYFAYISNPETRVDVGGIAKGYSADIVKEKLESMGIKKAILDFGGNIMLIGVKEEGEPWTIGVRDPFDERGMPYASIGAYEESVVTSGDYERYFEEGGKRYHHIIVPSTGYPSDNELRSVTVIGKSSMTTDAYATACMALGLEKAKKLIQDADGLEAVFILKDGSHSEILSENRKLKIIQ